MKSKNQNIVHVDKDVYLSHFSALKYWNFPLVSQYYKNIIDSNKMCEVLIRSRKDYFIDNGIKVYLNQMHFPENGLTIRNNTKIVSPYLLFLQISEKMDILETILLGNLLCSKSDGPFSQECVDYFKLKTFVKEAKGHKGRQKALRALKYIKNGACSIMEIFVHMFFRLPVMLGGRAIEGGCFNYQVVLTKELAKALNKEILFIDYCFPDKKIAYEYLGNYHNQSVDQDSKRNLALKRMGYDVITISKSQLYDKNNLQQLLLHVQKLHKKRNYIRTKEYEKNFHKLWLLLPRN
ncbi:MAG: DUF559 domain-containing protein [Clostridiaceae bacterium]|nr:DUF559 domain-containing protein [Clostridiaceae bacterium]